MMQQQELPPEEEIKFGYLKKRSTGIGGNRWRDRFFVFTNRANLCWLKDKKEWETIKRKGKGKKDLIALNSPGISLREAPKLNPQCNDAPHPALCFQIVDKDVCVLSLCANTEHEAQDWIELIKGGLAGRSDLTKTTVEIEEELRSNKFEISPQDLVLADEQIGQGASGVVKRGIWLKTTEVAIKLLKDLPEFLDVSEKVGFYREMETLSKLRHGSIVQMYGFCRKDNFLCLVTEFVKGGNLSSLLHQETNLNLDLYLQVELALNICRGMVYLHSQDVIHRDLKPANILVENQEEGKLKVCDFGLSTVVRTGHISSTSPEETGMGSPQYAAPELSSPDHTNKVDVFSFAIILWEIAMRAHPWPELKFGSQFAEKYIAGERPSIPIHNVWRNIIEKCWDKDPLIRPSFKDVFSDVERLKIAHEKDIKNRPQYSNSGYYNPQRQHSENSLVGPRKVDRISEQISSLFKTKANVPWSEFASSFGNALSVSEPSTLTELQFVFETEGVVTKQTWEAFLMWFSPLKVDTIYEPSQGNEPETEEGYDIRSITEICTAPWFHAFVESSAAQSSLKNKPSGTFLIRFSMTNPGSYALSVSNGTSVSHWRIQCFKKKPGNAPIFKLDVHEYESLDKLVKKHQPGGEPLKTKSGDSCFLAYALPRSATYFYSQ
eukprot:TRINITY_DN1353_c0_g1_i1.p1 TRINITY_DN1353_c0_g1~~TRINITY_DN1353_c0_g1_i1.p1  ORF type:complete len:663 (-),score=165.35 TRINITY_DN1353_c0_g1_i1:43-2031(-)